jgi:hypothetical protein
MAFQAPITIANALEKIQRQEYLLPAIQREFAWSRNQIRRLFDSLMIGYPVGSFLFWEVEAENSHEFIFYKFMDYYHQRDHRRLERASIGQPKRLTAVLDGQQRLTSLNIGLRGWHAQRLRYHRVTSDHAYPEKFLYLNLARPAEPNELGMEYDFRFLGHEEATRAQGEDQFWFPVADILKVQSLYDLFEVTGEHPHSSKFVYQTLTRLYEMVHQDRSINYFLESSQELEKVLNIFIRVNSGGTPLSYSDLLLSVATAQFEDVNARDEIHGLVDELNGIGQGFNMSKDQVLKAGLLLSDISGIEFRVTNFNAPNMATLEERWPQVKDALRIAAMLMAKFGYSQHTLSTHNVMLPIAYHIAHRQLNESFVESTYHREEREQIRMFVVRSLMKRGLWSYGLDTLLRRFREAIRNNESAEFPVEKIEREMAPLGKSLQFDEEELEELLDMHFHDGRLFSVLNLLYPGLVHWYKFHIDHVFPRKFFGHRELRNVGIPGDKIELYLDRVNRLPNMQILPSIENTQKGGMMPNDWMERYFQSKEDLDRYCSQHDLGEVPHDLNRFLEFYDARREKMARKLRNILGVVRYSEPAVVGNPQLIPEADEEDDTLGYQAV